MTTHTLTDRMTPLTVLNDAACMPWHPDGAFIAQGQRLITTMPLDERGRRDQAAIVLAVNNHVRLVRVLRLMLNMHEGCVFSGISAKRDDQMLDARMQARELLAAMEAA